MHTHTQSSIPHTRTPNHPLTHMQMQYTPHTRTCDTKVIPPPSLHSKQATLSILWSLSLHYSLTNFHFSLHSLCLSVSFPSPPTIYTWSLALCALLCSLPFLRFLSLSNSFFEYVFNSLAFCIRCNSTSLLFLSISLLQRLVFQAQAFYLRILLLMTLPFSLSLYSDLRISLYLSYQNPFPPILLCFTLDMTSLLSPLPPFTSWCFLDLRARTTYNIAKRL